MSKKTNLSLLILLITTAFVAFNYPPQVKESLALVPIVPGGETVTVVREDCTGYAADTCFTSLSAWEAAYGGIDFAGAGCADGDLVCANTSAVAKIDGTWSNPDTTAVTIDGWTTGENNYIKIYTTAEARHDGKWNTGRYRLETSNQWNAILTISEDYVQVKGLQVRNTSSDDNVIELINISGEVIVAHSIIRNGNYGFVATTGDGIIKVYNNVIYDTGNYGIYVGWSSLINLIYNNTVIDTGAASINYVNVPTIRLKNNIVQGVNSNYYGNGTIEEYVDNISENTTSPNDEHDSKVVTFVDEANDDFHLANTDTAAKDAGTNLSADANLAFSDDIDSETRPFNSIWDIGADEYTDTTVPSGYTVSIDQSYINSSNQTALSFTFASAEVGATYNYSIDDTDLGSPVTGNGTISTATDTISNIDVSGLNDDTLTLTVYLTDPFNNQGADATDTVVKDATAPVLSEITPISPTTDTTPSYIFSTDEAGTISYGGSCSGVTTSAVLGNNTITLNELAPGTYSNCTIIVTDALNNASNALAITSFTINSTGGGFISPAPPVIPLSSNQTFEITVLENQATINLNNIQNVSQIAISTTPDFKYVSWEPYEENVVLPDAEKVYLKFRSEAGGVSEIYEIETNSETDNNTDLLNGSLIRMVNDYKVYIINNNYIRHIIDKIIFTFYGHLNKDNVQEVDSSLMDNYQESFLIRAANDYKVYLIEDNKKRWLDITVEEFEERYDWGEVFVVNGEERDFYEMGGDVK